MNKKGLTLSSIYPAVLAIVVVGIVLGLGLYILVEVNKGISSDTITIVNETPVTFAGTPGTALGQASDCQARDFVINLLYNGSEEELNSDNYTVTAAGNLVATVANEFIGQDMNVSYTYTGTERTSTTDPCTTMETTGTGLAGFADWIAVIVVIIAAAIVLGIVLSSFGSKNGV